MIHIHQFELIDIQNGLEPNQFKSCMFSSDTHTEKKLGSLQTFPLKIVENGFYKKTLSGK